MKTYYVELCGGYCSLSEAPNLDSARKDALRENGTNNLYRVAEATVDQIAWVRAMGGFVPESGLKKLERAHG